MRACLIIILILILGFANAAKITVGPKDADYSVIQQAVDNASAGDIVEVQSGVYHENVYFFNMPVTLLGVDTGKGLPVVDAGDLEAPLPYCPMTRRSVASTSQARAIADAETPAYWWSHSIIQSE